MVDSHPYEHLHYTTINKNFNHYPIIIFIYDLLFRHKFYLIIIIMYNYSYISLIIIYADLTYDYLIEKILLITTILVTLFLLNIMITI